MLHALIKKFHEEGDENQRKLADSALSAIQHYNAIVATDSSSKVKKKSYNYEREQLLADQEIKGQQIELPHAITVKHEFRPTHMHPAHKTLKELSEIYSKPEKKTLLTLCPTHKESLQFISDTFRTKAIRMIVEHFKKSLAEIVPLVKGHPLEIDEITPDLFIIKQFVELEIGFIILVTGCFKRHHSQSKFMTMPLLDSFKLISQSTHTGFPYSAQYTGWALNEYWTDAFPLKLDLTPHFQQIHQRKRDIAHRLFSDSDFANKIHHYSKIKREVFDQNRHIFLPLHRQLQQLIHQGNLNEKVISILDAFYQEAALAPSAFDLITQIQQQILDLFIKQPVKNLEEEWLAGSITLYVLVLIKQG